MSRWLVGCLLALALVLPAQAQQDLTRDQVAAYVALTKADRARDRGESGAALAAYEEALAKYISIKKQDPRWHPDVVQYRMAYCANELEKLRKPTPPATAAVTAVPVPEASLEQWTPAKPPVPALPDAERVALQARIAELETALQVTQTLARVEAERQSLQKERDALQARVTQLESAPAPEPVVIPPDTKELERVQNELVRMTGEAGALQKRVTELTEDRDATAESARQLEALVKTQAGAVEKAEQERAQLAKEVEELKAALMEAKAVLVLAQEKASQQLQEALAKSDDKLSPLKLELAESKLALAGTQDELKAAQDALQSAQAATQAALQERDAAQASATLLQAQATQVDTNEIQRLKDLADTRLKAYEAVQRERDQMAPELDEVRNALKATKTALESALADKMALESKLSAPVAEPEPAAKVVVEEPKQAAKIKALQETIDLQEKEMGRVREYKKQVAELEKKLRARPESAESKVDQGALDQLNGQIKSLTRQLQAARDEATRREEQLRAMEAEAAALRKGH